MQWNEVEIDRVYRFTLDTHHSRQMTHEIRADQFPSTHLLEELITILNIC